MLLLLFFSFNQRWFLRHVRLFVTPWIAAHQASLSITISRSSLKLTSIESVMPSTISSSVIPFAPAPNPSQHQSLFQWVNSSHEVAISIIPSKEHPGLISFRIDWLDLLAVQGTLKSLLQHHSSKTSIHRHSVFFTVQLSNPYVTTGKTIALTRWTFVEKVMPLLFNVLSRLVITFLPRGKHLWISWLQSPCAVIWEPKKIKSATVSTVSPPICQGSWNVVGRGWWFFFYSSYPTLTTTAWRSPEKE